MLTGKKANNGRSISFSHIRNKTLQQVNLQVRARRRLSTTTFDDRDGAGRRDAGRNEVRGSSRAPRRVWMGDGKRGNLTCVIFHRAQHEKAYQKQLGVNQGYVN